MLEVTENINNWIVSICLTKSKDSDCTEINSDLIALKIKINGIKISEIIIIKSHPTVVLASQLKIKIDKINNKFSK